MSYIKLSNFQRYAGPVISARAKLYWIQGRVKIKSVEGGRYVATVSGTDEYETVVEIDGDEVVSHSCTCPFNGTLCKHEVALLLAIKDSLTSGCSLTPSLQGTLFESATDSASDSFKLLGVELTEKEMFLLGVLSCSGFESISYLRYIPAYAAKGMKISAQERSACMSSLYAKGFLTRTYSSWGRAEYGLKSEFCLDVLKDIIENHPNWLKFYKEELHPAPKEKYLVEVVELLLGKRETFETEWLNFASD